MKELRAYYEQKLTDCENYLTEQLNQFKGASSRYLSAAAENYCEQAKALLNRSNQVAFDNFYQVMVSLERQAKEGYPVRSLERMAESAKATLERSLKFNRPTFDDSIAYYRRTLK